MNILARLGAAVLFSFTLIAGAAPTAPALKPQPMRIDKLKEGLYVIRGPFVPCSPRGCENGGGYTDDGLLHEPGDIAVRVTSQGVIIVDNKYPEHVAQALELIKSVTPQPVRYALNSHYHADHVGGNGELLKRGIEVIVQQNLRQSYDRTKEGGDTPHIVFGNEGAIFLGGAEVRMYYYGPGHTAGDTYVYFPDLKVLHTGDTIVDAMPTIDYRDGGTAIGIVNQIYNVLKLDFDIAIPGHGAPLTKQYVRDYAAKMDAMNARMKDIVRRGVPKDRAFAELKLDEIGWGHTASTVAFSRGISGYYDEMAALVAKEKPAATP